MIYQIGDFSKIARVSVKTLRYYHEIGLICPSKVDGESGYRYYDDTCLERIRCIQILKKLKFSLKEIRDIMDKYEDDNDLILIMEEKVKETKAKIKEYQQIKKTLEGIVQNQKIVNTKDSPIITIKNVDDIVIASIRVRDKYCNNGIYMSKIAKQYSRVICGKPFTLYYDTEYKENDVDMEVCFPVKQRRDKASIKTRVLKGGEVLSVFHKGAYGEVGESYKILLDYINKNCIKTIVPMREIYIKGPGMVFEGNPKGYITEVQIMTCD